MGGYFLLQGIVPTQGSNLCLLCLLNFRQILYPLSHQGSSSRNYNEYLKKIIEVQLIYNVLISIVQHSDSVIRIYILFHILSHYGLSQDITYDSLCPP